MVRTCTPSFSQVWPNVPPVIVENGVRMRLNIVDTPGYGDQINNEGCWDPIIKYIKVCSRLCLPSAK